MSINKVILLGRLGKEPEHKEFSEGKKVCNLVVATSEVWKDKQGQKQEKTQWHDVKAWGKQADLCSSYLHKGSQVYIEGKLDTRSYEDKDGKTVYKTEIVMTGVQFIGSKADNQGEKDNTPKPAYEPKKDGNFANDDIPF